MSDQEEILRKLNDLKLSVIDLQKASARDRLIHQKLDNLLSISNNTNRIIQLENQNRFLQKQLKDFEDHGRRDTQSSISLDYPHEIGR